MNFTIAATSPSAPAPAATPASLEHRKLTEAAQQFEGMLLQEMLKPMKEHGLGQSDDQDAAGTEGSGGDTLNSYGIETMATAIAKAGGLGIAKRVVAQVEAEKTSHSQPPPQQFQNKTSTVLKSTTTAPMNSRGKAEIKH
jgi:Rod binding domain-containing protein